MRVDFNPVDYIPEHDALIEQLILEMSINPNLNFEGINYYNAPYNAQVLKLSEYAQSYGCAYQNGKFIGYFGERTYEQLVQQFLVECLTDYKGTPYQIDIDVNPAEQSTLTPDEISDYLGYMTKNLNI